MSADPGRTAAAHLLLDQLDVTLDDLTRPAAGPGANRTYGSYWHRMATTWGERRLDQITASDIEALRQAAAAWSDATAATADRPANTSSPPPAPSPITSSPGTSPAHRVAKPRRLS